VLAGVGGDSGNVEELACVILCFFIYFLWLEAREMGEGRGLEGNYARMPGSNRRAVESACSSMSERIRSVGMYKVSGSGWISTKEVDVERPCHSSWEAIAYFLGGQSAIQE
jgi:hypothetical protein